MNEKQGKFRREIWGSNSAECCGVAPPLPPLFPIQRNSRELRAHNARAGLKEGDEEFSPWNRPPAKLHTAAQKSSYAEFCDGADRSTFTWSLSAFCLALAFVWIIVLLPFGHVNFQINLTQYSVLLCQPKNSAIYIWCIREIIMLDMNMVHLQVRTTVLLTQVLTIVLEIWCFKM